MFEMIPTTHQGRWELMRSVIRDWMRPLTPADAVDAEELDRAEARLGCRLPLALREWYRLAGNVRDVWSRQVRLATTDELRIRDEVLVFCWENQGIWSMGVRLSDCGREDPPVVAWMNEAWDEPVEFGQLNGSVSECALQYLAWVMKWATHNPRFACSASGFPENGDIGWWTPATLAAIARDCVRCAFPVWRLWERDNVIYERPDLLVEVGHPSTAGDSPELYVTVRTMTALREFEAIVRDTGFQWDSGGWHT